MGKDGLTSSCESFRLTIARPAADAPRELHGTLEFASNGAATSVRVSLALFAHLTQRIGESGIAGEASIAGTAFSVARGSGSVPFQLPLPAVARAYTGAHLRIDPGILATSDDGKTLRVVVPAEWLGPSAASLCLRGLPKTLPVARPTFFLLAVAGLVLGAILLAVGAPLDVAWMYQLGAALVIGGSVFALVTRKGVLGWLRVGQARATLETGDQGLLVRVHAGPRAKGGRAILRAAEYEIEEGSNDDLGEVTSRQSPFVRDPDGTFSAVVPLPPASESPPSLELHMRNRYVGIRWTAVIELDTESGSVARFSLPVSVGIVAQ